MLPFSRHHDRLFAESVPLDEIARRFGTPCYVYSRAALEHRWREYAQAFADRPHLVCYAVKANSNLAILNLLAKLGSGFDIVSVGELERVLQAGGDPKKVVFAGVGKRRDEMVRALEVGIRCFNVESEAELLRLSSVAKESGRPAPISLRVNPDVDAKTHPYISTGLKQNKFGVAMQDAVRLYRLAAELPNIEILGVGCHIGSQLTELSPVLDAIDRLRDLSANLATEGIRIRQLDIGGGIGIRYRDEVPPTISQYAEAVLSHLQDTEFELLMEPGRSIVGNAGILLTRVEYLKCGGERNFAVVDGAMNDLLRPSLYGAWQSIEPVSTRPGPLLRYDIVGPVCESGDFLGKDRDLVIAEGDLLAIRSAGAYGFTMSSNYNSRPRIAEVMVDGDRVHLVGAREQLNELWARESCLPD